MGQVIASASMSLDGYIAKHDNTIGRLFDWLQNGDVEVPTVDDRITLHMSPSSAEYWRAWVDGLGALVCGRTLFDFTGGWDGMHTIGVPWWWCPTRSRQAGSRLTQTLRFTSSPTVWTLRWRRHRRSPANAP